jgi:hypothetical protein
MRPWESVPVTPRQGKGAKRGWSGLGGHQRGGWWNQASGRVQGMEGGLGGAVDHAQQGAGGSLGCARCSRLLTVSTGTPMRLANATWDKPTLRRTRRA